MFYLYRWEVHSTCSWLHPFCFICLGFTLSLYQSRFDCALNVSWDIERASHASTTAQSTSGLFVVCTRRRRGGEWERKRERVLLLKCHFKWNKKSIIVTLVRHTKVIERERLFVVESDRKCSPSLAASKRRIKWPTQTEEVNSGGESLPARSKECLWKRRRRAIRHWTRGIANLCLVRLKVTGHLSRSSNYESDQHLHLIAHDYSNCCNYYFWLADSGSAAKSPQVAELLILCRRFNVKMSLIIEMGICFAIPVSLHTREPLD
jgi:hypothetical protein